MLNIYQYFAYRNDANSIGFTSTIPFTITEHNEKNNDEHVANTMPKCGHEHDLTNCVRVTNGDRNR